MLTQWKPKRQLIFSLKKWLANLISEMATVCQMAWRFSGVGRRHTNGDGFWQRFHTSRRRGICHARYRAVGGSDDLDGLEQLLTAEQHEESERLVVDDQVANEPHELAEAEIVLIDSRLEESEALAAAAKPVAIVITFDSELETADNILSRIGDWAASSQQRISSLSIVSHGADGGFQFGKDFVTLESLSETENAWRSLSEHLTEDEDLRSMAVTWRRTMRARICCFNLRNGPSRMWPVAMTSLARYI